MYIANFNFLAQFEEESREEQTEKIQETGPKNNFLEAVRNCNETEKSKPPPKAISKTYTKSTYQI